MFSCIRCLMEGNKKSLVDAIEKGINLRECILKLFSDYYHGDLMKLVVIGGGKRTLNVTFGSTTSFTFFSPLICRRVLLNGMKSGPN